MSLCRPFFYILSSLCRKMFILRSFELNKYTSCIIIERAKRKINRDKASVIRQIVQLLRSIFVTPDSDFYGIIM